MIYCQACLTGNPDSATDCRKCGTKLLVLGGNHQWEETEFPRVSMEDHFLERISNIEETVTNMLDHLARLAESFEVLDRNAFVTRSGLSSLVETLRETNLLREELLYQSWETTMLEQMEEARYRDRFTQLKGRFIALYRGTQAKLPGFQALIDDAEFLLFSDRFHESAETLANALKQDPLNYELAYYLAEIYHQQGVNHLAIQFLHQALNAKADHTDSLLMVALIHYDDGDHAQAKGYLERCLEVNPHGSVALLCMGSILIAEDELDRAKTLLDRVNDQQPQAQSHYLLGIIAKKKSKVKQACYHLQQAAELDPNHEEAIFNLGMVYLERGWTRKAKTCFSRALELNPERLEYHDTALEPQQEAHASSDLERESEQTLRFAEDLIREGKLKQAVPHYRQLIKKHPTNSPLLSGYGVLIFSLRRYEETLKVARKILTLETEGVVRCVAFTLLMESYRALSRYEEAIDCLSDMLSEFPDGYGRAIGNYGLAMTKADMGQDLKNAETLALDALKNSPPEFRHRVLDALGWVYFKQGRLEEALELLENALALQENINHLYHYGMILLALNLQEKAFKVFERLVQVRKKQYGIDDFIFSAVQGHLNENN